MSPLIDFDSDTLKKKKSKNTQKLILFSAGAILFSFLGNTLASNISLNDNQSVEFGQGITQTIACDNDVEITPYSNFINGNSGATPVTLTVDSYGFDSGRILRTEGSLASVRIGDSVQGSGIPSDAFITSINDNFFSINASYSSILTDTSITVSRPPGRFMLNKFKLARVDSSSDKCANKAFTIKVYKASGSSPLATYEIFNTGAEFTSSAGSIISNFDDIENTSMVLTLTEPIASATDIARITIESKSLINLPISRIGLWPGSLFGGGCPEGTCTIPSSISESDFYCEAGTCNVAFLPAADFLELTIRAQCIENDNSNYAQCVSEGLSQIATLVWGLSENTTDDPDMKWQISISQSGPFPGVLHMDGQILYSNGQFAVFRWYVNTGDPASLRNYVDLVISFNGSVPTSTLYSNEPEGPEGLNVPIYSLSWSY